MGKSKQENATDQQGTPVYIIISLVFAILLFAVEGLKNSIGLSSESELRLASLAFVAEGLALCFFWRRLHEGTWKTLNAIVFTAGLWVYLFLMILTPMLLPQKSYLVQQVGFWIVIASSFLLMLNILFDSKLIPSSMLTAVVGLLAGFASIWGFVSPPRSAYGEKLLSSSKNQHNSEEPDQQHDEEEIHSSAFAEDEHDEPEPNSKKATHRSEPEEDEETTPKEIDEPRIDSKKVRPSQLTKIRLLKSRRAMRQSRRRRANVRHAAPLPTKRRSRVEPSRRTPKRMKPGGFRPNINPTGSMRGPTGRPLGVISVRISGSARRDASKVRSTFPRAGLYSPPFSSSIGLAPSMSSITVTRFNIM
jgi:hypothetical protein